MRFLFCFLSEAERKMLKVLSEGYGSYLLCVISAVFKIESTTQLFFFFFNTYVYIYLILSGRISAAHRYPFTSHFSSFPRGNSSQLALKHDEA